MKLLQAIGNTPLIDVSHLQEQPGVRLLAKLEGSNPGGSVKDRAALGMLNGALARGEIRAGDRLVEATSGNTGIALSMIGPLLGIGVTLVMPHNSTRERVITSRAYGAEVILTLEGQSMEDVRLRADALAAEHGWAQLDQFANPDNAGAHYSSTGPEIWRSTNGEVTHFVSAMGTTGTIMGVSRYLKEQKATVQIIGTRPEEGSNIPGIRRWPTEFLPRIYEPHRVDRIVDVSQTQAMDATRRLAAGAGILAGMSSGGALAAALRICPEIESGTVVFIVCDRGDRYLSSDLFAGTPADWAA